jgi:hypothetical protein
MSVQKSSMQCHSQSRSSRLKKRKPRKPDPADVRKVRKILDEMILDNFLEQLTPQDFADMFALATI